MYIDDYARQLGLDMERFRVAMDSHKFQKTIESEAQLARSVGINAVPTFIINGEVVRGAVSLEVFTTKVAKILARPRA
jgi:predicted DsbA family dithiol-disulfide isomerase